MRVVILVFMVSLCGCSCLYHIEHETMTVLHVEHVSGGFLREDYTFIYLEGGQVFKCPGLEAVPVGQLDVPVVNGYYNWARATRSPNSNGSMQRCTE